MKKKHLLFLLLIPCLLQSCFEVIEQVQLKNDGSGSYQLTLNMSQSKTRLGSIMKLKTINDHPVPSKADILARLDEVKAQIAKTSGISNVKATMDFNNFICVVSFDFSSVTQLNKAIKNVKQEEHATGNLLNDDFTYDEKEKIFQRKNVYSFKDVYGKMSNADKEVFTAASFTAIYKFDSEVNSVSNSDAKISASKKAVMVKLNAAAILKQKKSIENKIKIQH